MVSTTMEPQDPTSVAPAEGPLAPMTAAASAAAGALGLVGLVVVLVNEASVGEDWVTSGWAHLAGWSSFAGSCLLLLGLVGVAVRFAGRLGGAGQVALGLATLASAVTAGAMSTLALVVPDLSERLPEIITDPPPAVPPTFIFSGVVVGLAGIALARSLRVVGVSRLACGLLVAGSVVSLLPLPSRYFLFAAAIALVLRSRR